MAASQHFVPRDHQETVPSFSGPPRFPTFLPTYPPFWRFTVLHSPPPFARISRKHVRVRLSRKASSRRTDIGSRLTHPTQRSLLVLSFSISLSPPCSETTGAACERNKRLSNCLESLFIGHVANWCVFFSVFYFILFGRQEKFSVCADPALINEGNARFVTRMH